MGTDFFSRKKHYLPYGCILTRETWKKIDMTMDERRGLLWRSVILFSFFLGKETDPSLHLENCPSETSLHRLTRNITYPFEKDALLSRSFQTSIKFTLSREDFFPLALEIEQYLQEEECLAMSQCRNVAMIHDQDSTASFGTLIRQRTANHHAVNVCVIFQENSTKFSRVLVQFEFYPISSFLYD